MNFKQQKKGLILALVIAVGVVWWVVSAKHITDQPQETQDTAPVSNEASSNAALTVNVVRSKLTMMQPTLLANGSVAAWQEAVIGAEVSGLAIQEVLVNVGDAVKRGQVIARINASTVQADLAQAQANLAEAQANLNEAEGNAKRAREIQETGALSKQQIDQYLIAEASANARAQSAQAALQAQHIRLKQTVLIAPDSGVISKRDATVGQVVASGVELFRLIRQHRIEWRGEFNSVDIGKVKPGMAVKLTLPDRSEIAGKVRVMAPTADSSTRNTLVYVDIPSEKAKPGMFAKGEIALTATQVHALPYSAIVMRDGFNYLMQVDRTNHVHQVKVQLGNSQGSLVEVRNLPDPQARYVASGGAFLSDGDLVRVTQQAGSQ